MTRLFRNPRTARKARIAIALLFVAIAGGGTYTYTASNTVGASNAGYGTGGVTGYTVTSNSLHYTIDTANAGGVGVSAVTFTVDNKAGDVKIQLASSGTWYDCGATTGASAPFTVTCNTTTGGETLLSAVGANIAVAAVT